MEPEDSRPCEVDYVTAAPLSDGPAPFCLRCTVHHALQCEDPVSEVRNLLQNRVQIDRCQKRPDAYFEQGDAVNATVTPKPDCAIANDAKFADWLVREWSGIVRDQHRRHSWLEVRSSTAHTPADALKQPKQRIVLRDVSLGTFVSCELFHCHWKSRLCQTKVPLIRRVSTRGDSSGDSSSSEGEATEEGDEEFNRLSVTFNHDKEVMTVDWIQTNKLPNDTHFQMEASFDSFTDRVAFVSVQQDSGTKLYLFLSRQPKLYKGVKKYDVSSSPYKMKWIWSREVCFENCASHNVGLSNVVCLHIPCFEETLQKLLQRFQKQGFLILYGNPEEKITESAERPKLVWPSFPTFSSTYAWYCLLTRGFKVSDQALQEEFLQLLSTNAEKTYLPQVLESVGNRFDEHIVVNLTDAFTCELDRYASETASYEMTEKIPAEEQTVAVRRLVLTPTVVRGLEAELIVGNRVVRQYGSDRFIRVIIRDEDFQLLSAVCRLTKPVKVVTDFLREDLVIGDRRYHFLGCSNSQLREHGFWMYASDGKEGHSVEAIRRWMGDLTQERCVATYMSRLGQFFSASRNTIAVDNVELIPDVIHNGYCFTDGIGKISLSLAKKVSKKLKLRCVPSAFQIRFGGCKGVLSVSPHVDGDKIQVRESMEKFASDHKQLEVMDCASPGALRLNRQVIILMSGLGVPHDAFFKVQEEMLKRLADTMVNEELAVEALSKLNIGLTRDILCKSNVSLTSEPLLRSLLMNIYKHKLNDVIRARIDISPSEGRHMMGTVDETESLQYGEVFVKYSTNLSEPQSATHVLTGPVVIAKNPCFHPGDMRKFQAVDIPELHHMVDCVVFPIKGPRPHPNEMSGSDLDGDIYFVCWKGSLIPPGDNREAMDFTAKPKQLLDRPITENDMIEFYGRYIKCDQLGVLANAHLVHADAQRDSIFSTQCLDLAQMHSDAVDFPKTGCLVKVPQEMRPRTYPHYMEKRDKPSYTSQHVLADLHSQCKTIELATQRSYDNSVEVDSAFLIPGYENFIDSARKLKDFYETQLANLMAIYGIQTESEILTGFILKMIHRRSEWTLNRNTYVETAKLIRLQWNAVYTAVRTMFYEEFREDSEQRHLHILQKVSALYFVAYSGAEEGKLRLSLPWIFADQLLAAKKWNDNNMPVAATTDACSSSGEAHSVMNLSAMTSTQGLSSLNISCSEGEENQSWPKPIGGQNYSTLQRLSRELVTFSNSLSKDKELAVARNKRLQLFRKLQTAAVANRKLPIELVTIGSTTTDLDRTTSSLDVLVVDRESPSLREEIRKQIVEILVSEFDAQSETNSAVVHDADKTPLSFTNDGQVVTCYFSLGYIQRTTYILTALMRNRWMYPMLQALLIWAEKEDVTDKSKVCPVTFEQLSLLFISYLDKHSPHFKKIVASDVEAISTMLLQNHFTNCSALSCSHAKELYMDTTVHESYSHNNLADSIFQFFYYFSCSRGIAITTECDPSSTGSAVRLIDMTAPHYNVLAEQMLRAYHVLAISGSIHKWLNVVDVGDDSHIVLRLPRQISSTLFLVEEKYEQRLKDICEPEALTVRREKQKDDTVVHILEAWGSSHALKMIKDRITELEKTTPLFVRYSGLVVRQSVANAYVTIFEGLPLMGAATVRVEKYTGPVQPKHDYAVKTNKVHVPCLLNPSFEQSYSMSKFIDNAMRQVAFMQKTFDKVFHGSARAVISYGNFYTVYSEEMVEMSLDLFNDMVGDRTHSNIASHVGPDRTRLRQQRGRRPFRGVTENRGATFHHCEHLGQGARGRTPVSTPRRRLDYPGPMTRSTPSNYQQLKVSGDACRNRGDLQDPETQKEFTRSGQRGWNTAFIPSANVGFRHTEFYSYLETHGFVFAKDQKEYRVSTKLKLSDYVCANVDGVLVLDGDFHLKGMTMPDIKWLCANIITDKSLSGDRPASRNDVRFKIHTRLTLSLEDLDHHREDCSDLIDDCENLLQRNWKQGVIGVNRRYRERIVFVRYKNCQTYLRSGGDDPFMRGMKIRINNGTEYSRPNLEGVFRRKEQERTEITVIPEMPDIHDRDKFIEFLKRSWTFSMELGRLF